MLSLLDFIIIGLFFLLVGTIWWYATIPSNLPPGPLGLPFIGSALDTWRVATWFKTLTQWSKEYGSVYKLYIGNQLVLVLGDYDAIHEAMVKQGDVYTGRATLRSLFPKEIIGLGLAPSEGELWKTQRRFALSTLRDFGFGRPIIEPRIKDEAEYLLEAIGAHEGRPFDITNILANCVSNVICSLVFGRRFDYGDKRFHQLLKLLRTRLTETPISFMTPLVLSEKVAQMMSFLPVIKELNRSGTELMEFISAETAISLVDFQADRDEPMNYTQAFYKAKHEREENWTFTDNQLIASVANLFAAGTETSSTTLRWAILYMAYYPEIQEKVYQELIKENGGGHALFNYADRTRLPLTEAVIMETQRMANLLPVGLFRKTVVASKLRGYDIPVGTVVAPVLGAALWDPDVYPNPRKFDPTRFLNVDKDSRVFTHLIPFSAGKRICLGESLAKMELFMFFSSLILRYRFSFSPDEPKPPLEPPNALIHAPAKYKICAELRLD